MNARPLIPPLGAIVPPSNGLGIGALIPTEPIAPEPIPALSVIPGRMKSHDLEIFHDALLAAEPSALVATVNAQLRAEDERMRRMLPEAPPGMSWRGEIQARDHIDFQSNRGDIVVRLVYKLIDDRTGEDVFERWRNAAFAE